MISPPLSPSRATDQLTVNGGLGVDNVFGSSAALAKLVVTLSGEAASNAPGGVAFATPASYDAGKSPASVVSGNLFGKGAVVSNDFVVADAKTNSILSVVLADFNGDSHLDIAVTNRGSGNVTIFLNAGDGTFAAPALFPTTKTPGVPSRNSRFTIPPRPLTKQGARRSASLRWLAASIPSTFYRSPRVIAR